MSGRHFATLARLIGSVAIGLLVGCGESRQVAAPIGAVRIHAPSSDAVLFVDAHERGALMDGQVLELPVGHHMLEARRGGAVLASAAVEIRAAMILDATLVASAAPSETGAEPSTDAPIDPIEQAAAAPLDPNTERRAHYGEPQRYVDTPQMRDPGSLHRVLTRERGKLQRCYERALRSLGPQTDARINIAITIAPSGRVETATVEGEVPDELASCLRRAVREWQFDAASESTTATFPVVFRSDTGSGNP